MADAPVEDRGRLMPPRRRSSYALVPWDGTSAVGAAWYVTAEGDILDGVGFEYAPRGTDATTVVIAVQRGGTTQARELADLIAGQHGLVERDGSEVRAEAETETPTDAAEVQAAEDEIRRARR